jgi:hypothetical protein
MFETTQYSAKQKQLHRWWDRYVFGKQTLRELAEQTGRTKLAIKHGFTRIYLPEKKHYPRPVTLVVDGTFFGREDTAQWGVIAFRDERTQENVWWKFIEEERLSHYLEGREVIHQLGYDITSVTCDGLRGLVTVFADCPVQFCHFHQKQIIRRYVTKNPRLEAGIDLKEVVEMLGEVSAYEFKQYLAAYLHCHRAFLNEKTTDPVTGKRAFTHQRLRAAIRSLHTNLPYLFKYEKHGHLPMPTTINSLESHFSHIKDVVSIHRGLKRSIKEKMIETILRNSSIVKPTKKTRY